MDNAKIAFKLKCYNKLRNTTVEIDGTAVNRLQNVGASETDEDEQENLYPVLDISTMEDAGLLSDLIQNSSY